MPLSGSRIFLFSDDKYENHEENIGNKSSEREIEEARSFTAVDTTWKKRNTRNEK